MIFLETISHLEILGVWTLSCPSSPRLNNLLIFLVSLIFGLALTCTATTCCTDRVLRTGLLLFLLEHQLLWLRLRLAVRLLFLLILNVLWVVLRRWIALIGLGILASGLLWGLLHPLERILGACIVTTMVILIVDHDIVCLRWRQLLLWDLIWLSLLTVMGVTLRLAAFVVSTYSIGLVLVCVIKWRHWAIFNLLAFSNVLILSHWGFSVMVLILNWAWSLSLVRLPWWKRWFLACYLIGV
jgi:hypothetical protein